MKDTVKISVLVPCYNVEQYISQCLDSIIKQKLSQIEIICVNDGSTDGTLNILKRYERADERIKIINKMNTGYGDSMNLAITKANGEFIGIVESDDFIEPDMFFVLYEQAIRESLEISRGCYYNYCAGQNFPITCDFVEKNKLLNPQVNTEVFFQPPAIWCAIYRREWLLKNNIRFLPTPGASYQDTSFAFKCYACCNRFMMTDRCFVHYRTDNMQSSVKSESKLFCVCDEWNEIYRFVGEQKKHNLRKLLPILQYSTYKWNYFRLGSRRMRVRFAIAVCCEVVKRIISREIVISEIDPQFRIRFYKKKKKKVLHL